MWIVSGRVGIPPAGTKRKSPARRRNAVEGLFYEGKRLELLYLFEDQGELGERVVSLRKTSVARLDQILTSALTVSEVLVRPLALKAAAIERKYLEFFRSPALTVLPFDFRTAQSYARIREDRSIRPPDAIQLACAAAAGVDLFITNDTRLSKKIVPGVNFITSLSDAPL